MTQIVSNDELQRLVGEFCHGTLSVADGDLLDAVLAGDSEARQFYNNYMFLHAELYSQHASVGCEELAARIEEREAELARSSLLAPRRSRLSWLAIAAAILGVAAGSSWLTYLGTTYLGTESTRTTEQIANAATRGVDRSIAVAKITATRNCLWNGPSDDVGFGSTLFAGQRLDLAAGLVEVTFIDGAQVVLEGPAKFDVKAADLAALHEGRIAAVVPERARGFEIATNGLNVVDLGTEFGVWAEGDETEVHVFRGLVMAHLLDAAGQQVRTVELNTSEAARITPASSMVARIPARDDAFVRSLSVVSGPHDGLYAYEDFNYPEGPLSEQNGGFGWAGPWFNVESVDPTGSTNHVVSGGLEYEGMSPASNRAVQSGQQNRIRRSLSTSIGGVFDSAGLVENQDGTRLIGRDGTTMYLSFLQRVNQTDDVFYGLELHRNDGNANRVLCIGNGAEQCGYGVTSNVNVYGLKNFPALGAENTETNFIVVKITFGPGNRDRVQVFRNPKSLVTEEACVADAELVGNFAFDRIGLGNFNGTKLHEVDEIRVGTTFLAVTGRRSRGPDRLMRRMAALDESSSPSGAGVASAGGKLLAVTY
ncbi:MAG: FecR domain-containing protein [Pirellulales bacterium]